MSLNKNDKLILAGGIVLIAVGILMTMIRSEAYSFMIYLGIGIAIGRISSM